MPRRGRGQGQGQARFSGVVSTNSGSRYTLRNNNRNRDPGRRSYYGYSSQARLGPVHEQGENYYQTAREHRAAERSSQNQRRVFGPGGAASMFLSPTSVARAAAWGNHQRAQGRLPFGWGGLRNSTKKIRKSKK